MRKSFLAVIVIAVLFLIMRSGTVLVREQKRGIDQPTAEQTAPGREISGSVRKGETLFDIFKRYNLDIADLFRMREASASVHRLRDLTPNQPYIIVLDGNDRVNAFRYWIDDDYILNIRQTDGGFAVEKTAVPYEKRTISIGGVIEDNLIATLDSQDGGLVLALGLSDIFAWDIDFTTDLRKGDTFRVVVEGFYLDGVFRKFGDIIAAEFRNDGDEFRAYRYAVNGKSDYFDDKGVSLRKAFLKAPLSFRRISSTFSRGRRHPILKIVRPHHGLDYAAPSGTPVSSAGDGTVLFAGTKGQYGRLVILSHRNGYKTYYGHLSRLVKNLRRGTRVDQGQVIGYVGSSGLATGPHLHYEMRLHDRPVNPLSQKIPRGTTVPSSAMADFRQTRDESDAVLAATVPAAHPQLAAAEQKR